MTDEMKLSFDNAERIGVVGSPSSTHSLVIDILGTAVDRKLVGTLSIFNYTQDGIEHYALGQITELSLRNVWAEDPTMRGLIRQKGRVDPITGRQDTHTAKMFVSSVFGKNSSHFEPSMLGTVPATGTSVKLVDQSVMHDLLSGYSSDLFFLGKVYGSNVIVPMWFKHFGKVNGGIGEAYHIGVFGKTGSGKSVLSKMMLLGYARNKGMSIFVLDPQGEFAKLADDQEIREILAKFGKQVKVYGLHNLILKDVHRLFNRILKQSGFLDRLGIVMDDNKERALDQINQILQGKKAKFLSSATRAATYNKREVFDAIWKALQDDEVLRSIYTSTDLRERIRSAVQSNNPDDYYQTWSKVANLFSTSGKNDVAFIDALPQKVTNNPRGDITIIDLSETNVPENILWNDNIRMVVVNELLEALTNSAQLTFKSGGALNTLVVVDEAHRLAPREKSESMELERVKNTLKDAVRTTRKYGLGWMFVSQTLSSLDREIVNQIRIYVFGFGLSYGVELDALRDIIGGNEEAVRLYQLFKDPQSNPAQKEYSFMVVGPISPLSFSGLPLFFQSLKYPREFAKSNLVTVP